MYTQNGWWFLSSGGAYPPVFMVEMPGILVQLGHTQRTWKLAPQTDPKWSPTRSVTRYQD